MVTSSKVQPTKRSATLTKVMERFPVIVVFGACLIGWVGGETIVSDVLLRDSLQAAPWLHYAAAAIGALAVYLIGKYMQKKSAAKHETAAE